MFVHSVILFACIGVFPWRNLEIGRQRVITFMALVDLIEISWVSCLRRSEGLVVSLAVRGVFCKIFVERFKVLYIRFRVSCWFLRSICFLKFFGLFDSLFFRYSTLENTLHLVAFIFMLGVLTLHLDLDQPPNIVLYVVFSLIAELYFGFISFILLNNLFITSR